MAICVDQVNYDHDTEWFKWSRSLGTEGPWSWLEHLQRFHLLYYEKLLAYTKQGEGIINLHVYVTHLQQFATDGQSSIIVGSKSRHLISLYLYIYQNASVQNKDSVKKTYPCYIVTFQTNNNNYIISLNIQSVTLMLEVAVHYDRSQVDVEIKVDRG